MTPQCITSLSLGIFALVMVIVTARSLARTHRTDTGIWPSVWAALGRSGRTPR